MLGMFRVRKDLKQLFVAPDSAAAFGELPPRLSGVGEDDPPPDLSDLLPDAWLKSHPEHRRQIDDIRQEERRRSRESKPGKRHNPET